MVKRKQNTFSLYYDVETILRFKYRYLTIFTDISLDLMGELKDRFYWEIEQRLDEALRSD
jgi:hypothetical protein